MLKLPLDVAIKKEGLTFNVTSQQALAKLMLAAALPAAYDSTSARDTGESAAEQCTDLLAVSTTRCIKEGKCTYSGCVIC